MLVELEVALLKDIAALPAGGLRTAFCYRPVPPPFPLPSQQQALVRAHVRALVHAAGEACHNPVAKSWKSHSDSKQRLTVEKTAVLRSRWRL